MLPLVVRGWLRGLTEVLFFLLVHQEGWALQNVNLLAKVLVLGSWLVSRQVDGNLSHAEQRSQWLLRLVWMNFDKTRRHFGVLNSEASVKQTFDFAWVVSFNTDRWSGQASALDGPWLFLDLLKFSRVLGGLEPRAKPKIDHALGVPMCLQRLDLRLHGLDVAWVHQNHQLTIWLRVVVWGLATSTSSLMRSLVLCYLTRFGNVRLDSGRVGVSHRRLFSLKAVWNRLVIGGVFGLAVVQLIESLLGQWSLSSVLKTQVIFLQNERAIFIMLGGLELLNHDLLFGLDWIYNLLSKELGLHWSLLVVVGCAHNKL